MGTGHWLCHCYPASGPDGRTAGLGIIVEDVTEARRAEAALRDSEQRYRLLFETNPHPMWVYDLATLRFLAVNEAAIHRYGYSAEEFLAMTIAEIRPPEDVKALKERVSGIGQSTYLNAAGWRHVTKDGRTLDVEISSHAIEFAGRPARLVLAGDVTLRVRAEAAVVAAKEAAEAAREAAEAANRAKDRFLAVLSHELRTPLTPALLAVTSLLGDGAASPEQRTALEMVQRNIELEARLVDDLLDVAKIGRGNLRLDVEPCDVHEALREAAEICRPEIEAAGLRLEWSLAADETHALIDPARIKQVFWNLIRNAAKFTPAGGVLRIRSSNDSSSAAGRPADRLIVEFADTGSGIVPESISRIFEPFEQGEHVGRARDGGLGLGLAISRSIVEGHGGRLTAESPGRGLGATFRVELTTLPKPATIPPEPVAPVAVAASGVHVLVVEDNRDTRRFLEFVLRDRGFEVVAAANLEAARTATSGRDLRPAAQRHRAAGRHGTGTHARTRQDSAHARDRHERVWIGRRHPRKPERGLLRTSHQAAQPRTTEHGHRPRPGSTRRQPGRTGGTLGTRARCRCGRRTSRCYRDVTFRTVGRA